MRTTLEQAITLEREEMVMHRARRGETDRVRDLPDGGWVAALLDGAGDAVKDSLPALSVVPGQRSPSARRCAIGAR